MALREREKELLGLKGKINALSALLRLGHEAFEKYDLKGLGVHIVNNTRLIIPFQRAAFIDMRGDYPKLISLTGQSDINSNSEYTLNLLNLLRPFTEFTKPTLINHEVMEELNAPKGSFEAYDLLAEHEKSLMLFPFTPISQNVSINPTRQLFALLIEFDSEEEMKTASTMLPLLCRHYNEALCYLLAPKQSMMPGLLASRYKWFSPQRIIVGIAILFLISLVTVPVRQNVAADFEVAPGRENIYYAPYDGFIKECFFQNGSKVLKNQAVLSYDTKELEYKINDARKAFDEISAELEMIQQQSFNDIRLRGQVRLLQLKKARAAINISRNEWYLSNSKLKAKQDGTLDIVDADVLEGKAVRSGDRLFEVLSATGLIAEIQLNEQDASVLGENIASLSKRTDISLYLHSRPEYQITGTILSVSPRPFLTPRKTYCYIIKMQLKNPPGNLIYGMRGIARVSGGRVLLGQYLFRNLVLWWRKV
jgi:HlyD family secretion protein